MEKFFYFVGMVKQNTRGFREEKGFFRVFPITKKGYNMPSLSELRKSYVASSSSEKQIAILLFLKENIGKMFSSRAIATAINSEPKKYGVALSEDGIDSRNLARDKFGLYLNNRNGNNGFSDDLESLGFPSYKNHSVKLGKSGSQVVYGMVKIGK